jgi:CRISPR-associated protein Cas1
LAIAFAAVKQAEQSSDNIDRLVRREASKIFRKTQLIPTMIDKIKQVLRMEEIDGARDDHDD